MFQTLEERKSMTKMLEGDKTNGHPKKEKGLGNYERKKGLVWLQSKKRESIVVNWGLIKYERKKENGLLRRKTRNNRRKLKKKNLLGTFIKSQGNKL